MAKETPKRVQVDWLTFGRDVQAYMDEHGISYRSMEDRTGIAKSDITRVIYGKALSTNAYLTLCDECEIDAFEHAVQ